jgi:hypothetical protein
MDICGHISVGELSVLKSKQTRITIFSPDQRKEHDSVKTKRQQSELRARD